MLDIQHFLYTLPFIFIGPLLKFYVMHIIHLPIQLFLGLRLVLTLASLKFPFAGLKFSDQSKSFIISSLFFIG
jgi:hypothetical protein